MYTPQYTKLVKIRSKKLQSEPLSWHVYYMSPILKQCDFRTSLYQLLLKMPKSVVGAELVNGVWYWILQIPKFELITGKYYKVDYSTENHIIGKFKDYGSGNLVWNTPYFKQWKTYQSLELFGFSVANFEKIRLATKSEIKKLKDKITSITQESRAL